MASTLIRGILETETIVAAFSISSNGTGGLVSVNESYNWVQVEGEDKFTKLCRKCGGSGNHWAIHQDNGVCYSCGGSGVESRTGQKTLAQLEQMLAAKAREFARKEAARLAICAERDARVARLAAAEPAIAELLQKTYDIENDVYSGAADVSALTRISPFLRDMAAQIHNAQGRDLTERQLEAVRKFTVARPSKTGAPVVEGRYEIVGEIVSAKLVENDFGTTRKIIVKLESGSRVYGSLASNLADELYNAWYDEKINKEGYSVQDFGGEFWLDSVVGKKVKFTATVERSSKDEDFGFFKRPTKAEVVA